MERGLGGEVAGQSLGASRHARNRVARVAIASIRAHDGRGRSRLPRSALPFDRRASTGRRRETRSGVSRASPAAISRATRLPLRQQSLVRGEIHAQPLGFYAHTNPAHPPPRPGPWDARAVHSKPRKSRSRAADQGIASTEPDSTSLTRLPITSSQSARWLPGGASWAWRLSTRAPAIVARSCSSRSNASCSSFTAVAVMPAV